MLLFFFYISCVRIPQTVSLLLRRISCIFFKQKNFKKGSMCYKSTHCADKCWISWRWGIKAGWRALLCQHAVLVTIETLGWKYKSNSSHVKTSVTVRVSWLEMKWSLRSEKGQIKWFGIISLPVRWWVFCWSIGWCSSVMPVLLIWAGKADRKWWPSDPWICQHDPHDSIITTWPIDLWLIPSLVPVSAASVLRSKS